MVKRAEFKASMPPEYFSAAYSTDRWFGAASLMFVLLLTCVAATYGFRPAWLGVPIFGLVTIICTVRWFQCGQEATRYVKKWYSLHPYRGPAPRLVGPIRNFMVAQPFVAGVIIAVTLLGILAIATFQLVPAGT